MLAWGLDGGSAPTGALQQLWKLTMREAQTQTFADAFLAVMVCFLVAIVLIPLMHKVAPPKAPSADAH